MSSRKRGAPSSLDELQAASASLKAEVAADSLSVPAAAAATSTAASTSSSSSSSSASKRRESSSLHPRYSLSLQPQPPRHPFVGVAFPVQLFLVDTKKTMKSGWNVHIAVELMYETGELVVPQDILEVEGNKGSRIVAIGADGQASLSLRISQVSMKHENRSFVLRFSVSKTPAPASNTAEPLTQQQLAAIYAIPPVTTDPLTVIRHRLRITQQPPTTWYKDEGGRDKCISIHALLVDSDDRPVHGREVPLKVTLCYEGDEHMEVKNQSILKFPSETTVNRVASDGSVELKVRVEEVSKNHQKQAFVIRVAPDVVYSPTNHDIAADYTTAVTVLSKRNKRRKKEGSENMTPTLMGQNGLTSPMSTLANSAIAPAASSLSASLLLSSDFKPSAALSATVNSVASWCQYVHRGLTSLEWQHVGFEITEEGQVHLHRPLHRCPSCWVYKDASERSHIQPSAPLPVATPLQRCSQYAGCASLCLSNSIRPTKHDERCMLWLAKQRWQQEVGQQIQALQQLAAGSTIDGKPSRSVDSRERETTRGDRDRGEKDRQTETDDSSDSDSDSDSEADNSQQMGSNTLDYIPPLPLSTAASTGADEILPSVNPSFAFPTSATSFSQSFNMPQHSFTLPSNVPAFPLTNTHSFDAAAYDPDPPAALPPSPAEQQICALYAIHTDYGLPAFADSGVLLGFCVDQEAAGVVFYPLSAYDARQYSRIAEDVREVTEQYREAVRSGSGDVVWKKDWVDLDKLKEEAVLLLYTKNRGSGNNGATQMQQPVNVEGVAY